jgi:hypothetical protein
LSGVRCLLDINKPTRKTADPGIAAVSFAGVLVMQAAAGNGRDPDAASRSRQPALAVITAHAPKPCRKPLCIQNQQITALWRRRSQAVSPVRPPVAKLPSPPLTRSKQKKPALDTKICELLQRALATDCGCKPLGCVSVQIPLAHDEAPRYIYEQIKTNIQLTGGV